MLPMGRRVIGLDAIVVCLCSDYPRVLRAFPPSPFYSGSESLVFRVASLFWSARVVIPNGAGG